MHSHSSTEPSPEHVGPGYEASDMRANVIIASIVGLFVLLFAGVIFGVIYLRFMEASTAPMTVRPSFPAPAAAQQATYPALQMNPEKDQRAFLDAARKQLTSYGKVTVEGVDGGEHVVRNHIPIKEAIKYIASGAVPYRQEPKVAAEDSETTEAETAAEEEL